jgi:hypothetical protein
MKEYKIEVREPGGKVHFAVEWLEEREHVERVAMELAEHIYGWEAVVIVEREYKGRERVEMKVIPVREFLM